MTKFIWERDCKCGMPRTQCRCGPDEAGAGTAGQLSALRERKAVLQGLRSTTQIWLTKEDGGPGTQYLTDVLALIDEALEAVPQSEPQRDKIWDSVQAAGVTNLVTLTRIVDEIIMPLAAAAHKPAPPQPPQHTKECDAQGPHAECICPPGARAWYIERDLELNDAYMKGLRDGAKPAPACEAPPLTDEIVGRAAYEYWRKALLARHPASAISSVVTPPEWEKANGSTRDMFILAARGALAASVPPPRSQTQTPYVCDECQSLNVNWYDNCPHART